MTRNTGGHGSSTHEWNNKGALVRGYRRIKIPKTRKTELLHRLVAEAFIPNPEGKPKVLHLDGDGANNNKSNLKWATNRDSARVMKIAVQPNPLSLIGASLKKYKDPSKNKWVSQISVQGKQRYLGLFNTQEEAHERYLLEVSKERLNGRT